SGGWPGLGKAGVYLVVDWALGVDERLRGLASAFEQRPIRAQTRELQIGEPRLTRAEQLSLAADLEILLREFEAVGRGDERLEALLSGVRQLLPRARDEEAVRLLGAAADAASQLVQGREPESIRLLDDHDRRVP